jgi:hypothetical protein
MTIDDPRPPFDPDPETMRRLGYDLVDRLVEHLATLPEQRVARRGTYTASDTKTWEQKVTSLPFALPLSIRQPSRRL